MQSDESRDAAKVPHKSKTERHAAFSVRVRVIQPEKSLPTLKEQIEGCVKRTVEGGLLVGPDHIHQEQGTGADLDRTRLGQLLQAAQAGEVGVVYVSQLTRVVTQPLVRQEVRAWRVPGHRKEAPAGSPVGPPVAWPRATRAVDTDFRSIRRQHPRTPGRSAAWCR